MNSFIVQPSKLTHTIFGGLKSIEARTTGKEKLGTYTQFLSATTNASKLPAMINHFQELCDCSKRYLSQRCDCSGCPKRFYDFRSYEHSEKRSVEKASTGSLLTQISSGDGQCNKPCQEVRLVIIPAALCNNCCHHSWRDDSTAPASRCSLEQAL